jgi:hypothetical protein
MKASEELCELLRGFHIRVADHHFATRTAETEGLKIKKSLLLLSRSTFYAGENSAASTPLLYCPCIIPTVSVHALKTVSQGHTGIQHIFERR